ncbi:glycosyltransferase [Pleurocapsa sp. PCC 7319]|uniref:glycosyltransferase n=1 Tax=Pleurocapsa sp. PCC 7319 TaxID=118161 RepID=UPI000344C04B|nr:glycosyltransferase [Pleurocapsa sp. PCC 7319]
MYIALIAHYLGPRLGIGQYLERLLPPLVDELTDLGAKVIIFASPNAVEQTPALQKLKSLARILPPLDYSPVRRYAWVATNLANYCRREKIQTVVWLSNPIVLPWHPSTIAVIHDVNEWKVANKYGSRLKTWLRSKIYLDASLHYARKIILSSEVAKKDLCHFRPTPQLKFKLKAIANGNDSQLIDLAPVAIPAPTRPFLLSVGRIDPTAKRLPEAVALVSALREMTNQPWELHLIGGMNTSTQASGEAFLKSIENKHWVHYLGYVDDRALAQWYRQATAVVFLSENEGFGLPVAEAAAFGRWVVVSQTNQASGKAGGSAIIPVDAFNPHEGATKLLKQLQNSPSPPDEARGQQWQTTAKEYAAEICRHY